MVLSVIHSIFFYLIVVVSYCIGTTIAFCFLPFAKRKTKVFQTAAHLWSRFLVFCSGVRVTVSGLENIPRSQPVILAANHQGAADILIVLAFLPVGFRFAIKKELFKIPIFGWYLRMAGYFSVDRELVLSAFKIVEKIVEIVGSGESVLIFPEGTRTRTGELGKFKRGSLLAALKSGAPIVPVAISGSYNIMRRGSWTFSPCPVKLSIGKPIQIKSEEDYDNKVEEVRASIARMLEV
ncbi:MAG: lysophospholipid acyltransferase family protein [Candidatus Margulisbacteria bacterium]|nr:lysophospholipid acyltransferase family protein [Candidatus Margulisiibacteriota bacterium]